MSDHNKWDLARSIIALWEEKRTNGANQATVVQYVRHLEAEISELKRRLNIAEGMPLHDDGWPSILFDADVW